MLKPCSDPFKGRRFPRKIVSYAVWLYYSFTLSLRDVEELLAYRGIEASYETVRNWEGKFGPLYADVMPCSRPKGCRKFSESLEVGYDLDTLIQQEPRIA